MGLCKVFLRQPPLEWCRLEAHDANFEVQAMYSETSLDPNVASMRITQHRYTCLLKISLPSQVFSLLAYRHSQL